MRVVRTTLTVLTMLAAVLVALPATPASAAPACTVGSFSPAYWWANVNATEVSGSRKVLAVSAPWDATSYAYIWGYNGELRQQWRMRCEGRTNRNTNLYTFHLASNTSLCLYAPTWTKGTKLRLSTSCTTSFEQYGAGHTLARLGDTHYALRYCRLTKSPPSTSRLAPVTYRAASEARKTTGPAMSSGWPKRPSGMRWLR
jgi:hypothetical protein